MNTARRVAIVGAGLAGLACAERLGAGGHDVRLFDKSRGPGGRMASRRAETEAGTVQFDHGAQYFTVRDAGFRSRVDAWEAGGVAARWPAAGDDAWVGVPTMTSPAKALAAGKDIAWPVRIEELARRPDGWWLHATGPGGIRLDDGPFDAVILALPAEQGAPLAAPWAPELASRAAATPSAPCWTLMAAFGEQLPIDPDILKRRGIIDWASRNNTKPGRSGPESWVVHADADWSAAHLEEPADHVLAALLDALAGAAGTALPTPLHAAAHRWRYARSGTDGNGVAWDAACGIGLCGDWLLGPRVESAWLSGTCLAEAVLEAG